MRSKVPVNGLVEWSPAISTVQAAVEAESLCWLVRGPEDGSDLPVASVTSAIGCIAFKFSLLKTLSFHVHDSVFQFCCSNSKMVQAGRKFDKRASVLRQSIMPIICPFDL